MCSINETAAPAAIEKPSYEVADIFRDHIGELGKIPKQTWKIVNAITCCRTAKLGGHVLECDTCGHREISYNSCRNRHCPKCQTKTRLLWIEQRMEELLPIEYFHVVFSLPDILNDLILCNKSLIYNILFKAVKNTLLESTRNPKNLGAELGIIAILHSWGQTLTLHPHIHCVVTGGGLSLDGKEWISCNKGFLISIRILSALFRGKFLSHLKKAYKKDKLEFYGHIKYLEEPGNFKRLIDELYNRKWITYSKKPFSNPDSVLKYLGRYTHRIAISNHRIIKVESDKVTFRWKDYKDNGKIKLMSLDVKEFMRRFLLHILPHRFVKIRFYGLLSNNQKKEKLKRCRKLLCVEEKPKNDTTEETWQDLFFNITGIDITRCPHCGKGHLIEKDVITVNDSYKTVNFKVDSS